MDLRQNSDSSSLASASTLNGTNNASQKQQPPLTEIESKSQTQPTHHHQQTMSGNDGKRTRKKSKSRDDTTRCKTIESAQDNSPNNIQEQPLNDVSQADAGLLLTGTDFRNAGNRLCSQARYMEALNHYSKAIERSPDVSIHYSNRALCHLKLQDWTSAINDCRCALELDVYSLKAHYFIGQALAEQMNYDESLKHLQRAHELACEKQLNYGDDITSQIRLVKRRRWSKLEDDQAKLEQDLQIYLVNLIAKDRENRLDSIRQRLEMDQPTTSSSSDNELQAEMIQKKCDNYIEKVTNIFNNLRLQRTRRDVPDYLCGKISFEIMRDPVITPSGITYDRQDIEEHIKRVGHFDPITRQPLKTDQLISNIAMKEVVDAYLNDNEWAHYY